MQPSSPSIGAVTEPVAIKTRVLIADDHSVVRHGLTSIVNMRDDLQVIAEARDGEEALNLYRHHKPDVLLLDLRMPKLDGIDVLERILAENAVAYVLIMTTYDTDEDIARALKAGARGYLLKETDSEEIARAIRAVAQGQLVLPPAIAAKYVTSSLRPNLTSREDQVLHLLARGLSNKRIAITLNIEENTVKSHAKAVFTKLGAINRTEALSIAVARGMIRENGGSDRN